MMVVGAGLPSLVGKVGGAKPYAERLFNFRRINSLDLQKARLAVTRPAEALGVRWADEALDSVIRGTPGYSDLGQERLGPCVRLCRDHGRERRARDPGRPPVPGQRFLPDALRPCDAGRPA